MVKEHTIKLMAALVAFMMLAVGAVVIISDSQSDATNTGNETVNVYFDGTGSWVSDSYYKFNVFQAIQAACGASNLKLYIESSETDWTETTTGNSTYPNPYYGTISKVGRYVFNPMAGWIVSGVTESFHIYGSNEDGNWVEITPYALGWIRPFTDYADYAQLAIDDDNTIASFAPAFANIAIQMYGTSLSGISTSTLKSLTDPNGRSDCAYTFILKDSSNQVDFHGSTYYAKKTLGGNASQIYVSDLRADGGLTVYGYGSDAFLALIDATNGATYGQKPTHIYNSVYQYYTNYSWMDTMFGMTTVTTPTSGGNIYDYWASYKGTGTTAEYMSFNLGYHTQIPDAYEYQFPWSSTPYVCDGSVFTLDYERSLPPGP